MWMPDGAEHARLALHNMDVAAYLLQKPTFSDWAATVIFYSALHIVEIVLCSTKNPIGTKHCHDHGAREQVLKGTKPFSRGIWPHYRELSSLSRVARYLEDGTGEATVFETYLSPDKFREVFIMEHFGGLIRSASQFLSDEFATSLDERFAANFKHSTKRV